MKLVTRLTNRIYQDVHSGEIFATLQGLSKMVSVDYHSAELILFTYSSRILKLGVVAGVVKSPEGLAKDLLSKMLLSYSRSESGLAHTLAQAWASAMCSNTYFWLQTCVSSHFAAKIILDSLTANDAAKSLAQSLLLTDSIARSEELLQEIDVATEGERLCEVLTIKSSQVVFAIRKYNGV